MILIFIVYMATLCCIARYKAPPKPPPKQNQKDIQKLKKLYDELYINESQLEYYRKNNINNSSSNRAYAKNEILNKNIQELEDRINE